MIATLQPAEGIKGNMDSHEIDEHIKDLDKEVEAGKLWIAAHDAKINALWDSQKEWNRRHESSMVEVFRRLTAVEKRVVFIAGGMSLAGAIAGTFLSHLLK